MRHGIWLLVACIGVTAVGPGTVRADVVRIEADRDATLIEDPSGGLGNGSGPNVFAGRTSQAQGSVRRTLLRFDVAGALPERAIVEHVELVLTLNPSNPAPADLRLHRVLADWGEGASSASGGGGAPAAPGDATWIHTFWDLEFWTHAGGQFVGEPSAAQLVADAGVYRWGSRAMVRDVTIWRSAPHRNFGWVLIGDETQPQTSKSFASRENPDPTVRPMLEITYRTPGRPGAR